MNKSMLNKNKDFEREYERFLAEQRKGASGQRLEMLHRDLTGTKKLLEKVVWPAMKSFEGFVLEYEIVTTSGVKAYVDIFYEVLWFAMEANGYVSHVETITRERYSFEQMKIRSVGGYRFTYLPFSWDELDKKPELCLRSFYEQLGNYRTTDNTEFLELSVYQREVLRLLITRPGPVHVAVIRRYLHLTKAPCKKILLEMAERSLIKVVGGGTKRFYEFDINERGKALLLSTR
ncbi:hypothetical protein [Cohnella luojiensis]|uniref:Uncharacterized protein n=1 Tax=Cohnella luojiensis TaxID=652876 RepID=A0A4Y8M1S6_9BACL|nr:hypothetical protein [Cohnella luojiensis]TFE25835.1 hypothetical protein E2980_13040 [Cohnella luojiensis]